MKKGEKRIKKSNMSDKIESNFVDAVKKGKKK